MRKYLLHMKGLLKTAHPKYEMLNGRTKVSAAPFVFFSPPSSKLRGN